MKKISQKIEKLFYESRRKYQYKFNYEILKRDENYINIIFFLPATRSPSGGVIVAHHHSDAINSLAIPNLKSSVMYPMDINFSPKLFVHQSIFKRDNKFDINKDFVILPEVMASRYAEDLYKRNIRYAIHVQNGYLMDLEIRSESSNFSLLKKAYEKASIIIGNSNDTVENVKFVFPEYSEKIIRSHFVIEKHRFQPIVNKKNLITYMPRKLPRHSQHVLFFLTGKIPKNWQIMPIDGVEEQKVYDILYESKIFLSFSEFEGLAMPPAMAAMSGNRVIGYTGEANKEYFHLPCFDEIPCGDIKLFATKIIEATQAYENNAINLDVASIQYLEDLFSKTKQKSFLNELINKVVKTLN